MSRSFHSRAVFEALVFPLGCLALPLLTSCASLPLEESDPPVVAIFDPDESDIPMPNDAARDAEAGHLDLPLDDEDLTPADVAFRTYMNGLDAWSSAMQATVSFSGPVDLDSIGGETVQVYRWGATPERVTDVTLELEEQDTELVITPPRTGWERGARYVVMVRGGEDGIQDLRGRGIAADAAYYYLRLDEPLDDPANQRAFPGDTRDERMENAADLEEIRKDIAPAYAFFESRPVDPIDREDIASLWTFTVTEKVELAMDRPSQRVPLPWDLLIDPDTGLVHLDPAAWDEPIETDAKVQANELDGFGVSPNLMFELTQGVDPSTVNEDTIAFYELGGETPRRIPATYEVLAEEGPDSCLASPHGPDCKYIIVIPEPTELPLELGTLHALVVNDGLRAADGGAIVPMPIGHFMLAEAPLAIDGESQVSVVDDDDAVRLEGVRAELAPFLDTIGREGLVTAWPFRTLTVDDELEEWSNKAHHLGLDMQPGNLEELTMDEAVATLFPNDTIRWAVRDLVYDTRLAGIDHVVVGTLPTPYFLGYDRRFRPDGAYDIEDVQIVLTIPKGVDPGEEVPLIIFGHGVVIDARWSLLVSGAFAERGYATISITLPFHGDRTTCVDRTLIAIPNFFPPAIRPLLGLEDDLLEFSPCASGQDAMCSPEGMCLTAAGEPDEIRNLAPLTDLHPAAGAAFLDVEDIPYIKDHFLQGLSDMSSLHRAIFTADWSGAGIAFDLENVNYVGLSLGSIMGAVWVPYVEGIQRTALNVPGADMVDLFRESVFFGPQVDAFFVRRDIAEGSFEQARLLNVARWLIDSVDPHSVARHWRDDGLQGMIQTCIGDIIIPNEATEPFSRVSELPRTLYDSPLHMNMIIPGDALYGNPMVEEALDFIDGTMP